MVILDVEPSSTESAPFFAHPIFPTHISLLIRPTSLAEAPRSSAHASQNAANRPVLARLHPVPMKFLSFFSRWYIPCVHLYLYSFPRLALTFCAFLRISLLSSTLGGPLSTGRWCSDVYTTDWHNTERPHSVMHYIHFSASSRLLQRAWAQKPSNGMKLIPIQCRNTTGKQKTCNSICLTWKVKRA